MRAAKTVYIAFLAAGLIAIGWLSHSIHDNVQSINKSLDNIDIILDEMDDTLGIMEEPQ